MTSDDVKQPSDSTKRYTGYCTNVHAGTSLEEVKANLEKHSIPVRDDLVGDRGELGVGLWLSAQTVDELLTPEAVTEFRDWLVERRLAPYTFNGFPYGNFHQDVVKRAVYQPTWAEPKRLQYTCRLADIQAAIFAGNRSTISTLPLGWPHPENNSLEFKSACAKNLIALADHLMRIRESTGKHVAIGLEPEPGCVFDTAVGLVDFFENHLFANCPPEAESYVRQHIGVCHDVCHSAVMFESQATALVTYAAAGIEVVKVQVSSAVEADFRQREPDQQAELLSRLEQFAEPRYLHQTSVQSTSKDSGAGNQVQFFEDLPDAIAHAGGKPAGLWRVHFHVPIFQKQYGLIGSTQSDIVSFLDAIQNYEIQPDYEIETYAWSVLPAELQNESLDRSLIRELEWFQIAIDDEEIT